MYYLHLQGRIWCNQGLNSSMDIHLSLCKTKPFEIAIRSRECLEELCVQNGLKTLLVKATRLIWMESTTLMATNLENNSQLFHMKHNVWLSSWFDRSPSNRTQFKAYQEKLFVPAARKCARITSQMEEEWNTMPLCDKLHTEEKIAVVIFNSSILGRKVE